MNTVEKGNKLEDFVYDYLYNQVQTRCEKSIFSIVMVWKHKSYNKENGDSYIADVSIDCYLQPSDLIGDVDKPTITFIFECKNYNNKVDKSDFDEFQNKIEHTRYTKVKGYMITTSGYSEPTISAASYYGIGLIAINLDRESYKIIVSRRLNYNSSDSESYRFLLGEEPANRIVVFDKYRFISLHAILEAEGVFLKDRFRCVKFLNNVDIEKRACSLIEEINANELDSNSVLDKILAHLELKVESERLENGQLGLLNLSERTIKVSISLTGNRRNFTIAHEVGHYILHVEMLRNILEEYGETETSISLENSIENYMERQANHFASWLLITDQKLQKGFDRFRETENINKKYIYVDFQPDNFQRYSRLQDFMRTLYGVSWQVIEIRLKKKGWLRFSANYNPSHVSDIL